jgi:large subunit ribosomal protein L24
MKIKKGDTVKMLYGKDSGRQGTVVAIDTKKEMAVVEGLNMYKRNLKGDGRTRVSEIVTITKSVPVSKVMLVCPSCNKATRVGYKIDGDKKVRVCKKCGKVIEQKIEEEKSEDKTTKKTGSKKPTTKKKVEKKEESKSKSTKSKK